MTRASGSKDRLAVADLELEVIRRGAGRPLLLLHGFETIPPDATFLDRLSRHAEIVAPSHPGFGDSARPADFETVYDLVHLYLEVLETWPHGFASVMGLSFGGWLAAEVAVKAGARIDRLVLVDALGIKVSDRETPDILDVFNAHPREVVRRSWHAPERWAPRYDDMTDDELVRIARNRDALCLYGWHPYMHNPRLHRWLGRIRRPTLVVWGASDGVVTPSYGEAYSRLIPASRFLLIPEAGHHPEVEQPEVFADSVTAFLNG
ncbi:MAG TPA: alpha/beta hydrolase [Candidatus Methylomirabilis sp.]|nr:alpha/beta hydrolase [Candidatus Methylomirabilis sp.]